MNITILLTVAFVSFASGILTIKYVPDSFKWFLFAMSLLAGGVMGMIIPPQFNLPVCVAVVTGGAVPAVSRFICLFYEAERKRAHGRKVVEGING